jgi:hypothetical protein
MLLKRPCTFYLVRCAIFLFLFPAVTTTAQNTIQVSEQEAAYNKTIRQRAEKIVAVLDISDSEKSSRVATIIADQYKALNKIHNDRDEKIKTIKSHGNEQAQAAEVARLQEEVNRLLQVRHASYLTSLGRELNAQQIDQVKDGMTYGVVNITYKGYQDMIPTLTAEQKKQILTWLIEAREIAMDAESSDKKHAWFGKYKGRINNYLSAAGYDLKKLGNEWQTRLKTEQAAKKSQ